MCIFDRPTPTYLQFKTKSYPQNQFHLSLQEPKCRTLWLLSKMMTRGYFLLPKSNQMWALFELWKSSGILVHGKKRGFVVPLAMFLCIAGPGEYFQNKARVVFVAPGSIKCFVAAAQIGSRASSQQLCRGKWQAIGKLGQWPQKLLLGVLYLLSLES